MKYILLAVAIFSFSSLTAQQNQIELRTDYGSDNKEISDLIRFQGIEILNLKFHGKALKGKDYAIFIKEFTNGKLSRVDTIFSTKREDYFKPIDTTYFKFKTIIKTQSENKVKIAMHFDGFTSTKTYDIRPSSDDYALHDFLNGSIPMKIEIGKPTYIMGYFLPYTDKDTGWKKYCDVAGSKYHPEKWGEAFNIPNYFLVEIVFE